MPTNFSAESESSSDPKTAVNRERQLSDPPTNAVDGRWDWLFQTYYQLFHYVFQGVSTSLEDSGNPRPRVLSLETKKKAMKKR